jgi:lipid-binding SYLF domain-containing protein
MTHEDQSMTMQRKWMAIGATAVLLLAQGAGWAQQAVDPQVAGRRQEIDTRAQASLDELLRVDESTRALYDAAYGYAAFTATKAGFFVTGGGGTGVAVNKTTQQRVYMRMGLGGVGVGVGAQRYDLVIFFENEARLNRFIAGGWDASANAQAAAGSDGITLSSSFVDGVAFFVLTDKGLMAQADVSGTRFWAASALN